jgi:hypothetical protein
MAVLDWPHVVEPVDLGPVMHWVHPFLLRSVVMACPEAQSRDCLGDANRAVFDRRKVLSFSPGVEHREARKR